METKLHTRPCLCLPRPGQGTGREQHWPSPVTSPTGHISIEGSRRSSASDHSEASRRRRCVVAIRMRKELLMPTAAFFLIAAATRMILQHTIDTRYQIAMFWLLAVGLEAIEAHRRDGWCGRRLLANGLAATIAMVTVRFVLEGFPEKVARLL